MPTHEDAFLADIAEHPADDAPRLIFADWLEDAGQPDRAEFIRVQIERERIPLDNERNRRLARREETLLLQHEDSWRAGLPALAGVTWQTFSRGFVEAVSADTLGDFLAQAEAIFAAAPVRRLQAGSVNRVSLAEFAASPYLARLVELNLGSAQVREAGGLRTLARSPHLANLEVLLLHYNHLGDEPVRDLAACPYLGRLKELYLSGNRLSDSAVIALARHARMPRLTDLDLRDNEISDPGAAALAGSSFSTLETLYLVNNQIGPAGAAALAASPRLPRLARLYVNYNPTGTEGAVALAVSPERKALVELDLRHTNVHDAGGRALAESPHLDGLQQIWLGGNPIRMETLRALRRRFGDRLKL